MCAMTLAVDELDRATAVDNLADALEEIHFADPPLGFGRMADVHAMSPHITSSRKERYHSSTGFLKKNSHAVLWNTAEGRVT